MNINSNLDSSNPLTLAEPFAPHYYTNAGTSSTQNVSAIADDTYILDSGGLFENYFSSFSQDVADRFARTGLTQSSQPSTTSAGSLNAYLAVQAIQVLQSNADPEDKFQALTSIGVRAAEANQLISSSTAQDINGVIGIINSVQNWDNLTTTQQVSAVLNGWGTVSNITADLGFDLGLSLGSSAGGNAGNQAGSSLAGGASAAAGLVTGVASVVMGVDQAADVIDAVQDMPRSQAVGAGAQNLAITGASIGAGVATTAGAIAALTTTGATVGSSVPVVGTVVGAAIGAMIGVGVGMTGSGKNTGQKLRDAWRDAMESIGIAEKINGSHHLQLADGSTYDIGKDGSHKLQNVGTNIDGNSERYTFDVDWSNPVSVAGIPEAHVFAIATGLDPTDTNKHGLFDRAVAQSLNAASSNASSIDDVRNNFRAMLQGADPRKIASRIELLRATKKISDQEYAVYLHHVNLVFGTKLQASDAGKAKDFFIQQLSQVPIEQMDAQTQALLELLVDPQKIAEAERRLDERLSGGEGQANATARLQVQ